MGLFGRRKEKEADPPARDLRGDAAAMRAALSARAADGGVPRPVDLRATVRALLAGDAAPPTADVKRLVGRGTQPDDFYDKEIRPSWEQLSENERAARLEGFIELAAMLDASAGDSGLPEEMSAVVHTKTLLLAWAFDETYGYLGRLVRGETAPPAG